MPILTKRWPTSIELSSYQNLALISWDLRLFRRRKERKVKNLVKLVLYKANKKLWKVFFTNKSDSAKIVLWRTWKVKLRSKKAKNSGILASLTEAPAFVLRRLTALVGQVSQTMGNCLKSPTADDVSLLREGGNNSNSAEQLEQQPYSQVIFDSLRSFRF